MGQSDLDNEGQGHYDSKQDQTISENVKSGAESNDQEDLGAMINKINYCNPENIDLK